MIFKLGPFTLYRCERTESLDITLTVLDNWPCGFEYGYRDDMRGSPDKPWLQIRIGRLMVLYFEPFDNGGFEVWLMGFWWIK